MDSWEKLKVLGMVAVPVVLGIVGNQYTAAISDREVQGEFVALAVNILSSEETTDDAQMRKWAADVIDEYSGVKFG